MAHRSTGLFPRKAAYVDESLIQPEDSLVKIPAGLERVLIVAYFSADAAGSVDVMDTTQTVTIARLVAPVGGGKVLAERSGYELAQAGHTELSWLGENLTAGTVQVSLDAE
jgi:hypothetical protein